MNYFDQHIFVCENSREGDNVRVSCGKSNSKKIKESLKKKLSALKLEKKIRINMAGCLDRCELGPIQVSYPDGNWFCLKTEVDIDLFIGEFILKNSTEKIQNLVLGN